MLHIILFFIVYAVNNERIGTVQYLDVFFIEKYS